MLRAWQVKQQRQMEGRTWLPADGPGTWPQDLAVAAVLAHAGCSLHLHGSPTAGGDAGGNLQVMRQKGPARGAGWGWDGSRRVQWAHCKPQSEVATEGSLAHGTGCHHVPLCPMPCGCSTGACRVAPGLLGTPGAPLVHARACHCCNSGRVVVLPGASTGTSTSTGTSLLPARPSRL